MERTKRTAHLAVMHGREVIYVIEERAMLAAMPTEQLAALYPGPEAFPSRHETGVNSVPALIELLVQIRERGFSWEQDEVTDGFSSIAVPVLDRSGLAVASVP